jgi:hypothetical protein
MLIELSSFLSKPLKYLICFLKKRNLDIQIDIKALVTYLHVYSEIFAPQPFG